jgi:hypothetical protein
MTAPRAKLPDAIRADLDNCGAEWAVAIGKKHTKLYVNGQFVAVLSRGTSTGGMRGHRNIEAAITRAARKDGHK